MGAFFEGELNNKIGAFRDRRDKRLADRGLKFQVSHNDAESEVSDNGWVTIKGTHVLIDKDGNVQNGPGGLSGKRFNKATSTHFGKSAHQAAKEKHIAESEGMSKEVKEWADEYDKAENFGEVKKVEEKIIDKIEALKPGSQIEYLGTVYTKNENGKFTTETSSVEFSAEDMAPVAISYLSMMTSNKESDGEYQPVDGVSFSIKEAEEESGENQAQDENAIEEFKKWHEKMMDGDKTEFGEMQKEASSLIGKFPAGTKIDNGIGVFVKSEDGDWHIQNKDGSLESVPFKDYEIANLAIYTNKGDKFDVTVGDEDGEVVGNQEEMSNPISDFHEAYKKAKESDFFEAKQGIMDIIDKFPEGTVVNYNGVKMKKESNGNYSTGNGTVFEPEDVYYLAKAAHENDLEFDISEPEVESGKYSKEQSEIDYIISENKDNPIGLKHKINDFVKDLPIGSVLEVNDGNETVEMKVERDFNGDLALWYGGQHHIIGMAGFKTKKGFQNGVENPLKIKEIGAVEEVNEEPKFQIPEGENHWAKLEDGGFMNLETGEVSDSGKIPDGDIYVGDFSEEKGHDVGGYVNEANYEQHKKNTEIYSVLSEIQDGIITPTVGAKDIGVELDGLPVGSEVTAGKLSFEKTEDGFKDNNGHEIESSTVGYQIISDALYLGDGLKYKEYVQPAKITAEKQASAGIGDIVGNSGVMDSFELYDKISDKLKDLPVGTEVNTGKKVYTKMGNGMFVNLETEDNHSPYQIAKWMSKADKETDFVKKLGDGTEPAGKKFGEPKDSAGNDSGHTEFVTHSNKAELANLSVDEEKYTQERKDNAFWDKESEGRKYDEMAREYTGNIWKNTPYETKDSLYRYTGSEYQEFNAALRDGSYTPGGNGSYDGDIDRITEIIDQSSFDKDVWLQRGVSLRSAASLFGMTKDELSDFRYSEGREQELLDILKGKQVQDNGFQSCGSAKGTGFNSRPVLLNVYCPAGTKMLYVEPMSSCGNGDGKTWDGESKQTVFEGEVETLLQRGTVYRPTKVSIKGDKIYVDVEVIGQGHQVNSANA